MTDRDRLILYLLQSGPLSSEYLYHLTSHIASDRTGLPKRLKMLRDEGLIAAPDDFNNKGYHNHYYVHVLTEKGKKALKECGLRYEHATPTSGGFPHMIMSAAIVANIRMACGKAGLEFISQNEILQKVNKNSLVLKTSIPNTYIGKDGGVKHGHFRVIPDELFGIKHPDRTIYFALEADRGSYTLGTLAQTIKAYKDIITTKKYEQFGIDNLYPLIFTTAKDRAENIVKEGEKIFPKGSYFIGVGWVPGFKPYHKPPPLLPEVTERPLLRFNREPLSII